MLLGLPEQLVTATAAQPGDNGEGGGVQRHGGRDSTSIEGVEQIGDMYGKLIDICSLPAVHILLLYLVTMQVGLPISRTEKLPITQTQGR